MSRGTKEDASSETLEAIAAGLGVHLRVDNSRTGIGEDFRRIAEEMGIEFPDANGEDETEGSSMGGIGSGGNQQSPDL